MMNRGDTDTVFDKFVRAFTSFFHGGRTKITVLFVLFCHFPRTRLIGLVGPFLLSPVSGNKLKLAATRIKLICNAVNVVKLALKNVVKNVYTTGKKLRG